MLTVTYIPLYPCILKKQNMYRPKDNDNICLCVSKVFLHLHLGQSLYVHVYNVYIVFLIFTVHKDANICRHIIRALYSSPFQLVLFKLLVWALEPKRGPVPFKLV